MRECSDCPLARQCSSSLDVESQSRGIRFARFLRTCTSFLSTSSSTVCLRSFHLSSWSTSCSSSHSSRLSLSISLELFVRYRGCCNSGIGWNYRNESTSQFRSSSTEPECSTFFPRSIFTSSCSIFIAASLSPAHSIWTSSSSDAHRSSPSSFFLFGADSAPLPLHPDCSTSRLPSSSLYGTSCRRSLDYQYRSSTGRRVQDRYRKETLWFSNLGCARSSRLGQCSRNGTEFAHLANSISASKSSESSSPNSRCAGLVPKYSFFDRDLSRSTKPRYSPADADSPIDHSQTDFLESLCFLRTSSRSESSAYLVCSSSTDDGIRRLDLASFGFSSLDTRTCLIVESHAERWKWSSRYSCFFTFTCTD